MGSGSITVSSYSSGRDKGTTGAGLTGSIVGSSSTTVTFFWISTGSITISFSSYYFGRGWAGAGSTRSIIVTTVLTNSLPIGKGSRGFAGTITASNKDYFAYLQPIRYFLFLNYQ
jgi:hypothetical protein